MQGGTCKFCSGLSAEMLGLLPLFQKTHPMAKLVLKPSQEGGLKYSNPPVPDPLPVPGREGGDLKSHRTPGAEAVAVGGVGGREGRCCSGGVCRAGLASQWHCSVTEGCVIRERKRNRW